MKTEFIVATPAEGLVDVTDLVRRAASEAGVNSGLAVVFCPHTTAGLTINENADPDVVTDILLGLRQAYPDRPEFRHREGNSAAHLKAAAMGSSLSIIVENGAPVLGTWQGVYLCEFDGPRRRRLLVGIIPG
ncbi:MAG: secondary thiamine-phosphate synthase enzyme YjbQ [Deltaproteobacteria bacterium]|jgi:secondary thiamine-phosphate synthase enzyme|nr:secondary thiamine-phosphate synthase enzyme YjbQ [Deltaproteobacteria bacterium]